MDTVEDISPVVEMEAVKRKEAPTGMEEANSSKKNKISSVTTTGK